MPRRPKNRAVLAAAVAAAALLASAPLVIAATDTTQFAVTAGTLTFTTAPDVPNLPTLTLNGSAQTLNATMANFAMSDATGSGLGWNVSVIGDVAGGKSPIFKQYCNNGGSACGSDPANAYVAGGATLAANTLTLNSTGAGFTATGGTTGTAPTHNCGAGCNVDSASQSKIVIAGVGAGMGSYTTNSYSATSIAANTPSTTKALPANEVYRVDLVWTLNSGP
jgi:hypothetical protein